VEILIGCKLILNIFVASAYWYFCASYNSFLFGGSSSDVAPLLVIEMGSGVHAKARGPGPEAVSLRAKLAAVASLAVQDTLVTVLVSGVQHLVAHTALEALLMEGELSHHPWFGSVDRFATSWAFDLFGGLEGHCDCGWWFF